ncbi:alpha/beta fold hydrolase [Pseudonocardia oroxyli]|uniref:Pimeloyl-ACP methyl ester carboxylesterase n=1 Tax=Pseudonocardia oroxyli TaxID=366584 RepID=A0A1G8AH01_PSEOR|nr:alpha/beta hydrolase [Pseudonocardia oroxyli]SDH20116.1 Pimeloyl-ACP methyl ester carboxylesterase [Pseudonocardia oroxyli]
MSHAPRHSTPGKAGELSYLAWPGPADTTPILYLHPVNTAAAVWSAVAAALGGTRPGVAVDYRAHGRSEAGGPYLPADYAADALAVLDAAGFDRAHLVCGSIGGAVATEFAVAAPDRVAGVVAFGATLRVGWDDATLDDTERDLRALGVREWFVRHGAGILGPASRPEAAAELVELASGGRDGDRDVDTVVDVLRTTFGLADARPAGAALAARSTRPPARVFVGTHDPTCPPAMAHALAEVLGGDVHTMDGIGHLPMLEAPAATAEAIRRFHDEVEGSRG